MVATVGRHEAWVVNVCGAEIHSLRSGWVLVALPPTSFHPHIHRCVTDIGTRFIRSIDGRPPLA